VAWGGVAETGCAGMDDTGEASEIGELFAEIVAIGTPSDGVVFDGVTLGWTAVESFLSAADVCDAAATVATVDGAATPGLALLEASLAVAAIDVRVGAETSAFEVRLEIFEAREVALLLAMLSVTLLAMAVPVSGALGVCVPAVVLASDESAGDGAGSVEPESEGRWAGGSAGSTLADLLDM
jgi:hypothetical protein